MTGQPYEQEWDVVPPGSVPPPPPPAYGSRPTYGAQPTYGAPPPHGAPPPYGAVPPHGQVPPHPQPVPYGPGWAAVPFAPPAWPHGPGRPGTATTAAVLGFVTGGLTALVSLAFLVAVLTGAEDDPITVTLLLGLPCAAGLVTGAARLLGRHSPTVLFASALASVVVLFLALVVGAASQDADDVAGFTAFLVFALPLPVLTAVFARLPRTVGWAGSRA
ncbi:hypothetical protein GCM10027261_15710 [Geodermatophilus arenarius]|uniref:Uncharacterized protein n=1 Tax=Geodermatophilus arenarius TaxID=1137990 RepID=A0ABV9LIZ8_9ACTN